MYSAKKIFFVFLLFVGGIIFFDLRSSVFVKANDDSITLIGSYNSLYNDIVIDGNILYAAGFKKIDIFDISDPSNLTKIGEYSDDNRAFLAVDVHKSKIYASSKTISNDIRQISVIDVSNPSLPVLVNSPVFVPGTGVVQEVKVIGDVVYGINSDGLFTINFSEANPKVNGPIEDVPGYSYFDLDVHENYAYVASVTGGFLIYDVSNPVNPLFVKHVDKPGMFALYNSTGIIYRDNKIYLTAGGNGLIIFDVTDINNVIKIKEIDTPDYAADIEVTGNFAVVADIRGISIVDISDLETPIIVNSDNSFQRVSKLKVYGKYVFAADPRQGLPIYYFEDLPELKLGPLPFLRLPWDYESQGRSFTEAALSINSYFDHEYPFLSTSLVENQNVSGNVTSFHGKIRDADLSYSSHDGYDWGSLAGTKYNLPQLAAADGIARYVNTCAPCGNAIFIDHNNGFQTRYYHLRNEGLITNDPNLRIPVSGGQQIGLTGFSGNVIPEGERGAHIHFMVIEDKNNDGDFEDNIPDGLVDPFGWQRVEADPWSSYEFFYKEENRKGNTSDYLWTKALEGLSKKFDSNGGFFQMGKYSINFPPNAVSENMQLEMQSTPLVVASGNLVPLGSGVIILVNSLGGEEVKIVNDNYTLEVDLDGIDLSNIDNNTVSLYSSEDGSNWVKEESTYGAGDKILRSNLSHFSYFGVFAEKSDSEPPTTDVVAIGEAGEEGWFRSNVNLRLMINNSEPVAYTAYSINEENWQEYVDPLILTDEGNYTVSYYSEDINGNIENTKSLSFSIDKAVPEVVIKYDTETGRIAIRSLNRTEAVNESIVNGTRQDTYTIKDKAGNVLKIVGRFNLHGNLNNVNITSLTYNDELFSISPNVFQTFTAYKKDQLTNLSQIWLEKGRYGIINYNGKKDESFVMIKRNLEIEKHRYDGLKLLYLQTHKGEIQLNYE